MKVNILLSTYNGERFLEEQIRSIQAQTYQDWNLFIRDDGSTDGTVALIQQFVKEDQRIEFINENDRRNLGVIKSFHTLLMYQKADFYFFSDQDDRWLKDKLALTLEKAKEEDTSQPLMIYTDLKVVTQDLEVIYESMIRTQSHHANTQLVQELTENTVTGGTSLINHALAELWKGDEEIVMHDWYLALLAAAFGKLVYIDVPTQLYRQHSDNVLGARTLSKRMKRWIRPHYLFEAYWTLIKRSQKQASCLLRLPLKNEDRKMVEAYVSMMDKPFRDRYRALRKYNFRKNKTFHIFIFTMLIMTKFTYMKE